MKQVFKYEISHGPTEHELPAGAKCVYVGWQGDPDIVIAWFEVDVEQPRIPRRFQFIGTGHVIPNGAAYLGTANMAPYIPLVWHLYELDAVSA